MTFLRWYGLGAVGLTMIITCLGVEVYLIFDTVRSFFAGNDGEVVVDLSALLQVSHKQAERKQCHATQALVAAPSRIY
jgi:hypothetical protein